MLEQSITIIGAGHSGAKAAAALRKHGCSGPITLIGEEPHLPYDRPPLSKAVLLGRKKSDQCALFPAEWYNANGISLILGEQVTRIDRKNRRVLFGEKSDLPYDRLLLATGSTLIPLLVPGADLKGVWPLRTPQHADQIARLLRPGIRLVVIGAGVIGLEVAAAAVERGCSVRVVEMASLAMGRSLPRAVSAVLIEEHRKRGVDFRFGVRVASVEGDHTVSGITLETGEILPCDAVVFGVGVKPRTELAEAAGLRVDNGVRTNSILQTDDNRIFACGDVCRYESRLFGQDLRLENWRNAEDQADTAARNMLGQEKLFDAIPWFWSNQYDITLHVAGLPALGEKTLSCVIGSSHVFLSISNDGLLRGAIGIGAVRDIASPIRMLKEAIATKRQVGPDTGVDAPSPLGEIIGLSQCVT